MEDTQAFLVEYQAAFPAPSLPQRIAGLYRTVSCLKSGQTQQVYLLETATGGMSVILRVAKREAMPRLAREYRLLDQLRDGAFPRPIACFEEGEYAYLMREYIPGSSLADHVENGEALGAREAVEIACKICTIIEKLHELDPPVIHRDIKPQNIILSPAGSLHLVDLDAVQEQSAQKPLDTVVMGTAATAAPEQFGYRRCDLRTDVYGIGMLLVFLLTGGYKPEEVSGRRGLWELKAILRRCLRFDPRKRYASAARLRRRLLLYTSRWRRRAVAALSVALLSAAALGANIRREETPAPGASSPSEAPSQYTQAAVKQAELGVHTFASPLVERAVRLQLGREQGSITREEMLAVTSLFLCGNTPYTHWDEMQTWGESIHLNGEPQTGYGVLGDLSDFAYLPNLRELALYRLGISDLSPFCGLPLIRLGVGGNRITDLGPVARLTMLKNLDICDNPVSSLEPLAKCAELEALEAGPAPFSDLGPLRGLPISSLGLYSLPRGTDYSALASLAKLDRFGGDNVPADAVGILASIPTLCNITLFYSDVKDLSPFRHMPGLTDLNLEGNRLTSLNGVQDMIRLKTLNAASNALIDVSALRGHPALRFVAVAGNPLMDLSPLEQLPALQEALISRNQHFSVTTEVLGFDVYYRD